MQSVLEASELAYANKTKESITSQKLGSRDFWQIANSVLNKGKSAFEKAKLLAENFYKNSNLEGIPLPVFPSRTNLKLHNISVTPEMVKQVTTSLDLSKVSGPDCIPVVVLKNCEPERSYILAELFNKCLKESCFSDFCKVYRWFLYLRMLGKGLQVNTTALLVFFLPLVNSLKNL